jgi:hypothetical protein
VPDDRRDVKGVLAFCEGRSARARSMRPSSSSRAKQPAARGAKEFEDAFEDAEDIGVDVLVTHSAAIIIPIAIY